MNKIGVGIVGLSAKRGWANLAHVPALRKLPDFELRGLTASSRHSAQEAAAKFGVPFSRTIRRRSPPGPRLTSSWSP
jgi:predicted dehydrogenase